MAGAVLAVVGAPAVVLYRSADGDEVEIDGVFDERFILIDQARAGVEQVTPAVWFKLEDLPEGVDLDLDEPLLTIGGKVYRVRERQTDGATGGSVVLLLHVVE